jgi:hypothetical protein
MAAITRVIGPRARWRETTVGEYGSEFLGTFVLIMFGDGAVAMTVAALNQSGRGAEPFAAAGDWMLSPRAGVSRSRSPSTWRGESAAPTSTPR